LAESPHPVRVSTWRDLHRRKVVQWALGYVAVAWGLLQGLEFAVSTFDWPILLTRVAAVVAVTGLPLVVNVAWFHGDRGEQKVTRVEALIVVMLLVSGAVGVWRVASAPPAGNVGAATEAALDGVGSQAAPDRLRLAVLPFENLGNDPANAAFAGGVHDTLIAQIAKIPGLAVISRSSVMQFDGKHPTIRQVADALGVGSVIEGSIAREGKRVRIQAQLIDAATDSHLWSETYDRTTDDLFAVQSEIALAVADQLRVRLGRESAGRLKAPLTGNPEAYEHYVLGRSYAMRFEYGRAIEEFTMATTLDPGFAAAYAQLGIAYTWVAFTDPRLRGQYLPRARRAVEKAAALDPTLPDSHLARAVFLYRGEPDMEQAAAEFEKALGGSPNDAQALLNFGYLRRWQGRFDEAAALFKRAVALDPAGVAVEAAVRTLTALGRRKEASEVIAAASAARPDSVEPVMLRAILAGDMDCDLRTAELVGDDALRRFPNRPEPWGETWYFAWQTGDTRRSLYAAQRYAALAAPDDDSVTWRLGIARLVAGEVDAGRQLLRQYLAEQLEQAAHAPDPEARANIYGWVALNYSVLEDHPRALDYANRALREMASEVAPMTRQDVWKNVVVVHARAGDTATALRLLKEALAHPALYRASGIWCDPLLDRARRDARFRAGVQELGGNVAIDPFRRETWPRAAATSAPVTTGSR
jgi:adenylate cyclase